MNLTSYSRTCNGTGLRATGYRRDQGVVRHDASYTYDAAGRLTAVADSAAGSPLNGSYTWHADGTLASYPGPGYTRTLQYDDAGSLASITRDYGTHTQLAFEYQTGFDGKRRWKKDHTTAGQPEYWYPCGVACCAGELVTLISTDNGSTWQTHRTFVRGATGTAFINGESQVQSLYSSVLGYGSNQININLLDSFTLNRGLFTDSEWTELYNELEDEKLVSLTQAIGLVTVASHPSTDRPGAACMNYCLETHCRPGDRDCWQICANWCHWFQQVGCDKLYSHCLSLPSGPRETCMYFFLALCPAGPNAVRHPPLMLMNFGNISLERVPR